MYEDEIESYFAEHRDLQLEQFQHFISIPSVSTLSHYKGDIYRAAEYVAMQMRTIGLEHVELIETGGNPVVYGDWLRAKGKPTVLVYAHYDVQPAEPLELWESPAFAPNIRDGRIYARGASDDKSHVFLHLKVCEALFAIRGELPVNIKLCIEGEEEIGSPHLPALLEKEGERFAADLIVVSDSSVLGPNQPSVCYGLRGLAECELHVQGPKYDLHSGGYGGGVQNAIHALVEILNTLHTPDGRVAVQGFYDQVQDLQQEERAALARVPFDEEAIRSRLDVPTLYGEPGYSFLERTWVRPTLEINGIFGGHTEEGIKTIIPSTAHAKISCRLVPAMEPDTILALVEQHIKEHTPPGVKMTLDKLQTARPFVTPLDHPAIQWAAKMYEQAFQTPVYYTRMGGSIPIVETFARQLQTPIILIGFAVPSSNAHGPNEYFLLDHFDKGLRMLCHYWLGLAEALQAV